MRVWETAVTLFGKLGKVSIAFVDDHPVILDGVANIFSCDTSFDVIAKGRCASDAIDLCCKHFPDVIVVDLHMPGDAFTAIREITQNSPHTKVLVFTATSETDSAVKALSAGANGYVLKGSTVEELRAAILAVVDGETFISQSLANKVIAALRSSPARENIVRLSFREQQITKLLLQGRTNREIGASLKVTEQTVKHYMTVLIQKFQVRNRLEVAIAAQKLGIPAKHTNTPAQSRLN